MNIRILPLILLVLGNVIHAGSAHIINISNLNFNPQAAIAFLENGIGLLSENYTLVTSQKDVSLNNPELNELIAKMIPNIENALEVLRAGDRLHPEYNFIIETIFNFITFTIGHTYWKILEINKDVFRYEDGWYKKLDKDIQEKYAVETKEQNNVSVSVFNKAEFCLLVAVNNDKDLQNLIKILQYQELKRHEQLNLTRIAYIQWFAQIFGQTEKVNQIIEQIHSRVYALYNYHTKTYLLDQLIRTGTV